MAEEKNYALPIIAIVGIVAIVGLVMIFMNMGTTKTVPLSSPSQSYAAAPINVPFASVDEVVSENNLAGAAQYVDGNTARLCQLWAEWLVGTYFPNISGQAELMATRSATMYCYAHYAQ